MQIRIKATFSLLFAMAALSLSPSAASAQQTTGAGSPSKTEVALTYDYMHSNAPAGGCGCFNLNGGGISVAHAIRHSRFDAVGDVSVAEAGSISSSNYDLTLSTFTLGARYHPHIRYARLQPFAEALAGVAHGSGSLVDGTLAGTYAASVAFAANLGGGLDLRTGHRISYRLVQADYLLTTFNNGGNDRQNNLRLAAGIVIHF